MFNNVALDVFIGLVFVYLLYSLLATIIQEMLAQWFCLRSRLLIRAIRRMLEDENADMKSWEKNGIIGFVYSIGNLFGRFFEPFRKDETFIKAFYDHPTIKYLGENTLFSKPTYLHSHNFSQTIMQMLRGDEYDGRTSNESTVISEALQNNSLHVKPETLRHLRLLFADARRDSSLFKLKLEDWFDETMQRCTGWYKKQTQVILIIVGFCLAWSFNVDSIAISKILTKDKNAREQLVQLAISRQKEYGVILDTLSKATIIKQEIKVGGDTTTNTIETTIKSNPSEAFLNETYNSLKGDAVMAQGILGLNSLPDSVKFSACKEAGSLFDSAIAREPDAAKKEIIESMKKDCLENCMATVKKKSPYQNENYKVIGWLITALAISLGSAFWFDLLSKLIKLRGAGTKPNTSADTDLMKSGTTLPGKDANNMDIKG